MANFTRTLVWAAAEIVKIEIKIAGENNYHKDKIDAVKRAILSTETIEIENKLVYKGDEGTSTYWIGWKGAADYIREKRGIETPLEISFTDKDDAEIIICKSFKQFITIFIWHYKLYGK